MCTTVWCSRLYQVNLFINTNATNMSIGDGEKKLFSLTGHRHPTQKNIEGKALKARQVYNYMNEDCSVEATGCC